MLEQLKVDNFVLIDHLDMEFPEGFTCLTGETGSGKSILLGALSLLLGQKADKSAIRAGSDHLEVSGFFSFNDGAVSSWLDEHGIEWEDNRILIRRSIKENGRSIYSVNGVQITRQMGQELGSFLVDVSSQHAYQSLMRPDSLLSMVDQSADDGKELDDFREAWKAYRDASNALEQIRSESKSSEEEADYMRYCLKELENAALREGEEEELRDIVERISSSEFLSESITLAQSSLRDAAQGIESALAALRKAEKKDSSLSAYADRIESIGIECDDLVISLRDSLSGLSYSEEDLDRMNSRLSDIQRIKRRFGGSVESALGKLEYFRTRLDMIDNYDQRISDLEKARDKAFSKAKAKAEELSALRKRAASSLSVSIEEKLRRLGMESARFSIEVSLSEMSSSGIDRVRFLLSSNKGQGYSDIQNTASGGELSRLMLATKVSIRNKEGVPTLLFDEIDTGLGGVVANAVSEMLKELSREYQVIAITHLPQLAVKADQQYLVTKKDEGDRTVSGIVRLEGERRVKEIARLLSGETSDISLEHARRLLEVQG